MPLDPNAIYRKHPIPIARKHPRIEGDETASKYAR